MFPVPEPSELLISCNMEALIQYVFLICLIVTRALGSPQSNQVPILSQTQNGPNTDGSYQYSYHTGDGKVASEEGYLKNAGTADEGQAAVGGFLYTSPEGQQIAVSYIADEKGFQPQGNHLPTAPPLPPEIQRSLEIIASQPQQYDDQGNLIQSFP